MADPNPTNPPPPKGLAFHGSVEITLGEQTARLTGDGQRLTLHADSLVTLNALRQGLPKIPGPSSPPPDAIQDLIRQTQLHLSVVVNEQPVFELSPDHTSSLLGKALGIPGKVRPIGAVKSLLKRKRSGDSAD
ncbi:MAG: hypothetical protein AAF797_09380 [Planctomycetota bacterium]